MIALDGDFRHFGDESDEESYKGWMNADFMPNFFKVNTRSTDFYTLCILEQGWIGHSFIGDSDSRHSIYFAYDKRNPRRWGT